MKLSPWEWGLIGSAVSYMGLVARDERSRALAERIGAAGENAAREGVEPADLSEPAPSGWNDVPDFEDEIRRELQRVDEEAGGEGGDSPYLNLNAILMEVENELVTEHDFEPASARIDPREDAKLLKSTQAIATFTAWLNQCPEARLLLLLSDISWPVVRQRGPDDRACNFA